MNCMLCSTDIDREWSSTRVSEEAQRHTPKISWELIQFRVVSLAEGRWSFKTCNTQKALHDKQFMMINQNYEPHSLVTMPHMNANGRKGRWKMKMAGIFGRPRFHRFGLPDSLKFNSFAVRCCSSTWSWFALLTDLVSTSSSGFTRIQSPLFEQFDSPRSSSSHCDGGLPHGVRKSVQRLWMIHNESPCITEIRFERHW